MGMAMDVESHGHLVGACSNEIRVQRENAEVPIINYLADEKTRAAVERVLEVCGEAMNNLYEVALPLRSRSLTLATSCMRQNGCSPRRRH